ncbi:relaxase/mobilization nuclease domain-containing protein [Candidatus Ulvibacter alkanivorans]|uniref:relaxase/mobilization nuclease domain-containing protein n=1 Tax=Candidatus Ulvibacter alkanivorans TaxID=2267620 RepID=UPI000DF3CC53|nr:relaxase/mobilization nuclease domain-containing protein [Candidatus Ulvibacter alkanivorans]
MIIKSKSIKSKANLSNVLRYILVGHDLTEDGFVLSRAIRGDRKYHKELIQSKGDPALEAAVLEARIDNMLVQFETNNDKRFIPHAKANRAYHEILSFHAKDSKHLSKNALLEVARTYAKERSPNSLIVSSMHRNKDHLHIHVIVSAVELGGKVKRLSRSKFRELKQNMERYQDRFLRLEHSKVDHSKKKTSHF